MQLNLKLNIFSLNISPPLVFVRIYRQREEEVINRINKGYIGQFIRNASQSKAIKNQMKRLVNLYANDN